MQFPQQGTSSYQVVRQDGTFYLWDPRGAANTWGAGSFIASDVFGIHPGVDGWHAWVQFTGRARQNRLGGNKVIVALRAKVAREFPELGWRGFGERFDSRLLVKDDKANALDVVFEPTDCHWDY